MAEYLEYDWKASMVPRSLSELRAQHYTLKTPVDRVASLEALRSYIQTKADAEIKNNMPQDEATLVKFLFARKFDVEETYTLIQNYYWYRRKHCEIFKDLNINADDVRKSLENVLPGVLDSKDRKGRCVLILHANNWDCSYTLMSVYRAILCALEILIKDIHNQANGFVVLVDWTEFSFRQTTNLKPGVLKLMIEGLQDCFPARFKGIHFIGQPWYVEAALTVIKPFLKDKTKERIYVHGNNLSTLHDYVAKDILPTEMGGDGASYNPEIWLKSIMKTTSI